MATAERTQTSPNGTPPTPVVTRVGESRPAVVPGRKGGPPRDAGTGRSPREQLDGLRGFATDLKVLSLLLNESRYRTMQRVFGVPRDQVNIATVMLILLTAEAASARTDRMLHGPGGPTRADAFIGAAVVKEALASPGGARSRDVPLSGSLILAALLWHFTGPTVRRSAHAVRAESHRIRVGFDHRYGHLIGRRSRRQSQR